MRTALAGRRAGLGVVVELRHDGVGDVGERVELFGRERVDEPLAHMLHMQWRGRFDRLAAAAVITTNAPRLSVGHDSRFTNPRSTMRVM